MLAGMNVSTSPAYFCPIELNAIIMNGHENKDTRWNKKKNIERSNMAREAIEIQDDLFARTRVCERKTGHFSYEALFCRSLRPWSFSRTAIPPVFLTKKS